MIPVVIAPRPLRKNCWYHTDWSKSDSLWWLLRDTCLQVCFLDDRVDIVHECCHRVGSKNLRVILCTQPLSARCPKCDQGFLERVAAQAKADLANELARSVTTHVSFCAYIAQCAEDGFVTFLRQQCNAPCFHSAP